MTNGEKFKTAEERKKAFEKYFIKCIENHIIKPKNEFEWLELEAKEELLPCPFCGGEARIIDLEDPEYKYYQIRCSKCMCKTESHLGMEETIAVWNRRVR
jgi:Lar family restriction alleviation protein